MTAVSLLSNHIRDNFYFHPILGESEMIDPVIIGRHDARPAFIGVSSASPDANPGPRPRPLSGPSFMTVGSCIMLLTETRIKNNKSTQASPPSLWNARLKGPLRKHKPGERTLSTGKKTG